RPYRWNSGTQSRDPGPILKHRSGPSSQLLGPIAGFLARVEDAQRLRLPSAPLSPAGAYRFAPDPGQKSESEKQKEREGKKIGVRMLSFARGSSLGRFQPQAAVSSSSMLEQPEHPRWREVLLPGNCGKKGYRKAWLKIVVYCDNPS